MKVFQNNSIFIVFIFWAFIGYAELFNAAAVIISGNEFHHEGLAIEASLLQKGYDVQLIQSKCERFIAIDDWSKYVENLKDNYKRLLFIITGHGDKEVGVHIYWDSLLKLIQTLEGKADELFVHVDTCYSGIIVDKWMGNLGKKLKIFTTSSCAENKTSFVSNYPNHTNPMQLFSGYYMRYKPNDDSRMPPFEFGERHFNKLKCNANVDDVCKIMKRDCCATCYKTHIHKGEDEELRSWHLLPINLNDRENMKHHLFPDLSCKNASKAFDQNESILFNNAIDISEEVNNFDPISGWRIRTVDIVSGTGASYYAKNELKQRKIPSYSTLLSINGPDCEIVSKPQGTEDPGAKILQKFPKEDKCKDALRKSTTLTYGYHENKNKMWTLNDDGPDNFLWILLLIVGCVVAVLVIAGICVFFIIKFYKKKRKRTAPKPNRRNINIYPNYKKRNYDAEQNRAYDTTIQQHTQIEGAPQNYTG